MQRKRLILKQYKSVQEMPGVSVAMNDANINKWLITINQDNIIAMVIPDNYPLGEPEFRFVAKTAQFSANEKICLGDDSRDCAGIGEYIILLIAKIIESPVKV